MYVLQMLAKAVTQLQAFRRLSCATVTLSVELGEHLILFAYIPFFASPRLNDLKILPHF